MNRHGHRRTKLAALAASSALLLSGCDFDVYSLPLPGGADVGDDPIRVTAEFRDVLDLVPQSTVKVDDITVGRVEEIEVDGYAAKVTLLIRNDVELPDDAEAQIRQTSLLGEKFVSLAPPESNPSSEPLESGDNISLERTGRNPEVEEVLGALSLILNGGGVAQLKTISNELTSVFKGREGTIKSVLDQIRTFMTQLDGRKRDILTALEKVNSLSVSLNSRTDDLDLALQELPSAIASIDRQRDDLVKMLQALSRLSGVGTRVIQASKAGTIKSLNSLAPILTQLARAGTDLPDSLQMFLTFPFIDGVVGKNPQQARDLHMGDYTNLDADLQLDVQEFITAHSGGDDSPGDGGGGPLPIDPGDILGDTPLGGGGGGGGGGLPDLPGLGRAPVGKTQQTAAPRIDSDLTGMLLWGVLPK